MSRASALRFLLAGIGLGSLHHLVGLSATPTRVGEPQDARKLDQQAHGLHGLADFNLAELDASQAAADQQHQHGEAQKQLGTTRLAVCGVERLHGLPPLVSANVRSRLADAKLRLEYWDQRQTRLIMQGGTDEEADECNWQIERAQQAIAAEVI